MTPGYVSAETRKATASPDLRYKRRDKQLVNLATATGGGLQEAAMKLSARNVLPGKVKAITKGQTTSTVKIDIGHGLIVTASITNEAVDDLALKNGDAVSAIIKASEVIVGK